VSRLQPDITPEHAAAVREAVRDYYHQREVEQFEFYNAPAELLGPPLEPEPEPEAGL
jgi:hypothetical protein